MRTTITLDDKILADAKDYSGIQSTKDLLQMALKEVIHRGAAMRLAKMGGTEPDLVAPPRRRFEPT